MTRARPAEITAGQVAQAVGGRLHGDAERPLDGVRPLEEAGERDLAFLSNPRYRDRARSRIPLHAPSAWRDLPTTN